MTVTLEAVCLSVCLSLCIQHGMKQGSQTQIYRRATFQRQNDPRAAVYWKKSFAGRNLQENPSKKALYVKNKQNLMKISTFNIS